MTHTNDTTPPRVGALDALRGWAIVLVIAVHVSHWVTPTTPSLRTAITYGFTGVELFFVVSALSLFYAHVQRQHSSNNSILTFYLRRAFRILPMLWVAMAFYLWRSGLGPRDWAPQGISLLDVAIVALGANGWHPLQINAVIPVGWSVGVEFSFYLIFPALALWVRSLPRAVIALAAAFGIASAWSTIASPLYLTSVGDNKHLSDLTLTFLRYMSLPAQFPVFMAGFVVYFLWPYVTTRRWIATMMLLLSLGLYTGLVLGYRINFAPMFHYTAMMSCFALGVLSKPTVLFDNTPMRWIGKVSYSAYLIHMFVIYQIQSQPWAAAAHPITGDFSWLIAFLGILGLTVAFSSIAYFLIEQPGMRLGAKLVRHLQEQAPQPLQAARSPRL
jgi:exopolysaccharide production protein ExoZ